MNATMLRLPASMTQWPDCSVFDPITVAGAVPESSFKGPIGFPFNLCF